MYFQSLAEMWAMGGHGPYVWGAYLIGAVTLATMLLSPLRRRRRFLREQAQVARRQLEGARRSLEGARRSGAQPRS